MKPAHPARKDLFPIEIAAFELRCRFVAPVVKNHWRADPLAAIAVHRRHVRTPYSIMLKPLIKRFDTHRPHAPCDKLSNWIFHHRGGNARFQAKAIRQIGSHIEFPTTDMDLALRRLPKRHYAWIKSMHHRSQCQEVPFARRRNIQSILHSGNIAAKLRECPAQNRDPVTVRGPTQALKT